MRPPRWPRIGDLIVRNYVDPGDDQFPRYGLVYEIIREHGNVLIEWSNQAPRMYNRKYGYSCYNIQNCRAEFDIIRNGELIQ
jgi:hypothetical protein